MTSKLTLTARYLLGFVYFASGGVMLFQLVQPPPDMPGKLKLFMDGIMASGYLLSFIKATEFIGGILLLLNIAPALILIVLAPVSVNIFLVHFFLTPGLQNLAIPGVIIILHIFAALRYWPVYRPLFLRHK